MLDIFLKPRYRLGAEVLPWINALWIQNYFTSHVPIFLSYSLCISRFLPLTLPPSLSHHFTLLQILLNHLAPCLCWSRVSVQVFTNHFPLSSDSLSNIQWVVHRETSVHIVTFQLIHPTPFFPLLALHSDPLTTSYVLWFMCSYIWLKSTHFHPGSHDDPNKN